MKSEYIQKFCEQLSNQDRKSFQEDEGCRVFVPDLVEIIEDRGAEKIVAEVGDMSVNQWAELLAQDLEDIQNLRRTHNLLKKRHAVALGLCETLLQDLIDQGVEDRIKWYKKEIRKAAK